MYRITSVACAALLIVAIVAFTVPRFGVPRIRPGFNPSPLAVASGSEILQSFKVQAGGLNRISIRVLEISAMATIDAAIGYYSNSRVARLHERTLDVSPGAEGLLQIEFPALDTSGPIDLALTLRVRGSAASAFVSFQTTEGHEYADGALWLDDQRLPADLVMTVDALYAQPWRALGRVLRRRTGVSGLEWVLALGYLGATCALLRSVRLPASWRSGRDEVTVVPPHGASEIDRETRPR